MGKITKTSGVVSNKSKEPVKEVIVRGRRKKRGKDLEELHQKVLEAKRVLKTKVPAETNFIKEVQKFNDRRKQNDNQSHGINDKTGLKQGPKKICDKLLPRTRLGIYNNGAKGKTLQKVPVVLDEVNRARLECNLSKLLQGPKNDSKNIAANKLAEILHKSSKEFSDSDDDSTESLVISPSFGKLSHDQPKLRQYKYPTNTTDTDDQDIRPSNSRTSIDFDKQNKCTRRLFVKSTDEIKANVHTNSKHSSSSKENIKSRSPSLIVDELCWSPMTRYEQLCNIVRNDNFEDPPNLSQMVPDPSISIRMNLRSIYTKTFKQKLVEQSTDKINSELTIDKESEIQACSYDSEFSSNDKTEILTNDKDSIRSFTINKIAMDCKTPPQRFKRGPIRIVSRPPSTARCSLAVNYDPRSVKPTFNSNSEPDERQNLMMRYLADVEESRKRNAGRHPDDSFDISEMELRRPHLRDLPKRHNEELLEHNRICRDTKHNKHVPAILRRSNPSSLTDKSYDRESLMSNEDFGENMNVEKSRIKFFLSPSILNESMKNQSKKEQVPEVKYKPISNLFSPKPKKNCTDSSKMIEFGDFELSELERDDDAKIKHRNKQMYRHGRDSVNVASSSSRRHEFTFDTIEQPRQQKSIQLYENKGSLRDNTYKLSQESSQDLFTKSDLGDAAKKNSESKHYDEFELQNFYKPSTVRNDAVYLTRKDSFKSGFNFALENLQSFDFEDSQNHLFSPERGRNTMKQPAKYLAFDASNDSERMPLFTPGDCNPPERIRKSTKYIGILKKKPVLKDPYKELSRMETGNNSSFVYDLPPDINFNQDKYTPCCSNYNHHVATENYSSRRIPFENRETFCEQCHK